MNREAIYSVWAPEASPWSTWAKPVLFAHMNSVQTPEAIYTPPVEWAPAADGRTVIVLDLPGINSVWHGLSLARLGYRPVALFNAAPGPRDRPATAELPAAILSLVSVWPILDVLAATVEELAAIKLPADAPPVFMLDSDRRVARRTGGPGDFDNRSVSLPTDFPSANLLLSRGITATLLVQQRAVPVSEDLAHTLRRWQDAGLKLNRVALDTTAPLLEPLVVHRPSRFRWMWHNMLVAAGLRRNPLGGFGGMLPVPSAG